MPSFFKASCNCPTNALLSGFCTLVPSIEFLSAALGILLGCDVPRSLSRFGRCGARPRQRRRRRVDRKYNRAPRQTQAGAKYLGKDVNRYGELMYAHLLFASQPLSNTYIYVPSKQLRDSLPRRHEVGPHEGDVYTKYQKTWEQRARQRKQTRRNWS